MERIVLKCRDAKQSLRVTGPGTHKHDSEEDGQAELFHIQGGSKQTKFRVDRAVDTGSEQVDQA